MSISPYLIDIQRKQRTMVEPIDETGDLIIAMNGLVIGDRETGKGFSPYFTLMNWYYEQGIKKVRIRIEPVQSSEGKSSNL